MSQLVQVRWYMSLLIRRQALAGNPRRVGSESNYTFGALPVIATLVRGITLKVVLKCICHNHHFFSKIYRDETIQMKYTILRTDKYFQRYLGSKLSF